MKNLVAKAGVAAAGSMLLLATAGVESANALFIQATETFSVSEDVFYKTEIGTGSNDRQFRSYNPNPANLATGRYNTDDSIMSSIQGLPYNEGGDVTDMAIAGSFTSEEIRGLVEFNLKPYRDAFAALDARADAIPEGTVDDDFTEAEAQNIKDKLVASALLNFEVFQLGGLHPDNQNPLALDAPSPRNGTVQVSFYEADGLESLVDYGNGTSKTTSEPLPGTEAELLVDFITQDLVKGNKVSLNIATAVNEALSKGWDFLGFRLSALPARSNPRPLGQCAFDASGQATDYADCGAIAFHKFTIGAVPTPAAILPTLFGMGMAAIRKRKGVSEA